MFYLFGQKKVKKIFAKKYRPGNRQTGAICMKDKVCDITNPSTYIISQAFTRDKRQGCHRFLGPDARNSYIHPTHYQIPIHRRMVLPERRRLDMNLIPPATNSVVRKNITKNS